MRLACSSRYIEFLKNSSKHLSEVSRPYQSRVFCSQLNVCALLGGWDRISTNLLGFVPKWMLATCFGNIFCGIDWAIPSKESKIGTGFDDSGVIVQSVGDFDSIYL